MCPVLCYENLYLLQFVLQVTFKDFLQLLGQLLNVSDLSFDDCDFFMKQRAATFVILRPLTMTYISLGSLCMIHLHIWIPGTSRLIMNRLF